MKYYRFSLVQHPQYETLVSGPEGLSQILQARPDITNLREISRSTYYRLQRKDAQAFWDHVEQISFGEAAR